MIGYLCHQICNSSKGATYIIDRFCQFEMPTLWRLREADTGLYVKAKVVLPDLVAKEVQIRLQTQPQVRIHATGGVLEKRSEERFATFKGCQLQIF